MCLGIQKLFQIHLEQHQPVLFRAGWSVTVPICFCWWERGKATRKLEAAAYWLARLSVAPTSVLQRKGGEHHERYHAAGKPIGNTCWPAIGRMDLTWKPGKQEEVGEGRVQAGKRERWMKAPPQFKASATVTRSSRSRRAPPSFGSEWPSHQLMLRNVSKWMFNMRTKCSLKSNHPILKWDGEKRRRRTRELRSSQIALFLFSFFPFESFKRNAFNCSSTTIAAPFHLQCSLFPPQEAREWSVFIFNPPFPPFAAFK